MDLSKAEIEKLKQAKEVFKIQKLNRQQLTRRCQEILKTKLVDNKLKTLLLCVQNHIQSRCMKILI